LAVLGKEMSLLGAFSAANDVLLHATQGIAELITRPGLINVDFADVKTVMSEMGVAMMGTGAARGEHRAREAAEAAIRSPLLEDIDLAGAKGILVNITAGMSLTIGEFDEVGNTVRDFADDDATVVVGTVIDPALDDELRVTVVATGLGERRVTLKRQGAHEAAAMHLVSRRQQRERTQLQRPGSPRHLSSGRRRRGGRSGGRERSRLSRYPGLPASPGGLIRGFPVSNSSSKTVIFKMVRC
jgi:cell division protein FtsZ